MRMNAKIICCYNHFPIHPHCLVPKTRLSRISSSISFPGVATTTFGAVHFLLEPPTLILESPFARDPSVRTNDCSPVPLADTEQSDVS